jgi:hypothetical protein
MRSSIFMDRGVMASANFEILHEVRDNAEDAEWVLCFQWGIHHYSEGEPEHGYRFIWRKPNDHLAPERGQARIPSAAGMFRLIEHAGEAGWLVNCERVMRRAAA